MKRRWFLMPILCLAIVGSAGPIHAAWRWKMPTWPDFGKKEAKAKARPAPAARSPVRQVSHMQWPSLPKPSLPTLPKPKWDFLPKPAWNPFSTAKPGEPSALQKLGDGTKQFFSKTKDMLTPWEKKPDPRSVRSRPAGVRNVSRPKPKKKSLLGSLFGSGPTKPPPPQTVPEFLSGKRPSF